jgi:NAD/NADP transhydrogenase alpha subunit
MSSEYNSELLEQLARNKPQLNVFALDCIVKNARTYKIDTVLAMAGIVGN